VWDREKHGLGNRVTGRKNLLTTPDALSQKKHAISYSGKKVPTGEALHGGLEGNQPVREKQTSSARGGEKGAGKKNVNTREKRTLTIKEKSVKRALAQLRATDRGNSLPPSEKLGKGREGTKGKKRTSQSLFKKNEDNLPNRVKLKGKKGSLLIGGKRIRQLYVQDGSKRVKGECKTT